MNNIKNIFEKENLIVPDYNRLNIVNLIQMLFNRYGINYDKNDNINYLDNNIPKTKHTLFIIVDGMGSNLVDYLDNDSLFKRNKKEDLLTVSPSTTGCVLTTIATGCYPNEHGIIGWYSYNREFNIDYYPLLFSERDCGKSLNDYNINPDDIYKVKSKFNTLNVDTKVLYPNYILNSVYSNFVADNSKRIGYDSYEDAIDIIRKITSFDNDTFTYLYISNIDSLEHDNGVYNKLVINEINKIEKELSKLLDIDDLTIIVTADHGQTDVDKSIVMDFNKYKKYFYGMPGIDFSTATFYVKEDKREEFENEFKKDFEGKMLLFKTEEFLDSNIFGIENNSDYFKSNLGEYIGTCINGYFYINSENTEKYLGQIGGNHSGFSSDELIIPLIVINNKR